jgi:hypothetical protein
MLEILRSVFSAKDDDSHNIAALQLPVPVQSATCAARLYRSTTNTARLRNFNSR